MSPEKNLSHVMRCVVVSRNKRQQKQAKTQVSSCLGVNKCGNPLSLHETGVSDEFDPQRAGVSCLVLVPRVRNEEDGQLQFVPCSVW